jgi:hypothetical protein
VGRAGFRVNRGISSAGAEADIEPNHSQNIGPLKFQAGASAPTGTVTGQWVIFTSDPARPVIIFDLHGTVLP